MDARINRRDFMKQTTLFAAGLGTASFPTRLFSGSGQDPLFRISLAQWSLNRKFFSGELDNLDFAKTTRSLGIDGVEYVNQFFMDKAKDMAYLREMKNRAENEGVQSILIMCDNEGALGAPDEEERKKAVENHYKWVDAAKFLGCHSIRVNGYSTSDYEESQKLVADGLSRLIEYADTQDINVIVENHGGYSSNAKWLVGVMKLVDHPRVGTLPDFGNFRISQDETYDSYEGVREMMPYAKGVSVKPQGYDANGNSIEIDLARMMRIVLDAGYHGYCGIEHGPEGRELEAIRELNEKLIQVRDQLAAEKS
jgi:sugar phosphate isomerase/epimerase